MLTEKTVFCSAFTPQGWVQPVDCSLSPTLLVHTPPVTASSDFWKNCFSCIDSADEIYADPLFPKWLEGFHFNTPETTRLSIKICDHLHPRSTCRLPFTDGFLDLYAFLPQIKSSATGIALLQRRTRALLDARRALETAHSFLAENMRSASANIHVNRTVLLANDLFQKISSQPIISSSTTYNCTRFFTMPSAFGITFCSKALQHRAKIFFLLEDDCGAASRMLLYQILCLAKKQKEPVCIGRCPLFWPDKIDHLIFPRRGILLTVCNRYHRLHTTGTRLQCVKELMSPLSTHQLHKINANQRQADHMFRLAALSLRETWRLQAALSSLCPLQLPADFGNTYIRTNMTAKNIAEI